MGDMNIVHYMLIYTKIFLLYSAGDLMDEENVLNFLTSLEALDLPDRIEEVNSKILQKIIEDTEFVAVLFCEYFIFIFPLPKRTWFLD